MADDSSTEQLRLFVAIPMPETVRKEIVRVQQELQQSVSRDAVRWTKPEQFHLTLRFLGDVPAERAPALQAALKTVCLGSTTLSLRAHGIGFFPNARSPRVIWAGINDSEGHLVELQQKIETAVQPFTQEAGADRFAGHVTLGRVKFLKQPEIEKLATQAQAIKNRLFGEWPTHEVELIRSKLLPTGASHTVLAAIHLASGE